MKNLVSAPAPLERIDELFKFVVDPNSRRKEELQTRGYLEMGSAMITQKEIDRMVLLLGKKTDTNIELTPLLGELF